MEQLTGVSDKNKLAPSSPKKGLGSFVHNTALENQTAMKPAIAFPN
jgi:hypothetical protein